MLLGTAVGAGMFFGLWQPRPPETVRIGDSVVTAGPATSPLSEVSPRWIVVHVAGEVTHPGLVRVEDPARVGDVIRAAGGARADALLGAINLAAPVTDGSRVVVPGPESAGQGATGPESFAEGLAPGPVSLNRASGPELEAIPGLGPVLAARILNHRDTHGPFRQVEDLLDVPGIGERKLAGIREYLVLS